MHSPSITVSNGNAISSFTVACGHGKSVGTQVIEQPSPLQRRRDGLQASAHLAAQLQTQRAGRMKFHTKLIHMLVLS